MKTARSVDTKSASRRNSVPSAVDTSPVVATKLCRPAFSWLWYQSSEIASETTVPMIRTAHAAATQIRTRRLGAPAPGRAFLPIPG